MPFNRRTLFQQGGLLALMQAFGGGVKKAVSAPLEFGANMYKSIGVRPLINSRGTFTIISGSQTLPEVKKAMDQASRTHVNLDELMDGVAQRLSEITGAEWGMVSAGCAAGLAHVTTGIVTGGNPERLHRLPNVEGLKNECIIPAYSRNDYDSAVRMSGVKLVEVRTPDELEAAFNERTAMVYILAGNQDDGPLGTAAISAVAKKHNVPVVVDAAAEILTIPNVHLQRGADIVAYSGGKCLRGPQAAGLMLGNKKILQAAWIASAPHHGWGRSIKVGKEEIMGMLAAVEMWVKRDHDAEWKTWLSWLDKIGNKAKTVDTVTTSVSEARGLSNRTPRLDIRWDAAKIGMTGSQVMQHLLATEPRINLAGGGANNVSIVPYMMMPDEVDIVANRIHAVLSKPPQLPAAEAPPQGEPVSVAGQWNLDLICHYSTAKHKIMLEQNGATLMGTHQGEFASGDLNGAVAANTVRFQSAYQGPGSRISYRFTGTVDGGKMSGTVDLGEYGVAQWTAERHQYRTGGRGRRG